MAAQGGRVTLWGLEVFVTAAVEPSLSAAARRLGVGTATVSQQLSNLEAALGVELLDRGVRPLCLTAAGRMFLTRAVTILDETRAAQEELTAGAFTGLPRLRLGMIEDFDADVTPYLIKDMAGLLETCRFDLQTGPSHVLLDALDARSLDVVVAADSPDRDQELERYPLLDDPFVIVAPRGSSTGGWPDLPYIAYSRRQVMGRDLAAHLLRHEQSLPHRFELDSYPAILALVSQGEGWSILTALGWRYARRFSETVQVRPLPIAPLSRRISVLARAGSLGNMPQQVAAQLRATLNDTVRAPAIERWPFLADSLRVL